MDHANLLMAQTALSRRFDFRQSRKTASPLENEHAHFGRILYCDDDWHKVHQGQPPNPKTFRESILNTISH
jgi:hypothetical protein